MEYEKLTFTDNFIFCKVMQNYPDICKELVELITGRKIAKMVNLNSENTIEITPDGRGVRLDVYFEDESVTMYDIEMQVEDNQNLPKRSRFYQSMMDSQALDKNIDYLQLKDSYVIFICPFNIFPEYGYHRYTFRQRSDENSSIILEDGTSKIFVCAEGSKDDVSDEMKHFLMYLSGQLNDNPLITKIDTAVKIARLNKKWREEYMLTTMDREIMKHQYEKIIEEKDELIAEKDSAIAEKDSSIAEKDSAIAEKDSVIAEKDSTIAEKNSVIAEKDDTIANQTSLIKRYIEAFGELKD